MLSRSVRCVDCGFLLATLAKPTGSGGMEHAFENDAPATLQERNPSGWFASFQSDVALATLSHDEIQQRIVWLVPIFECKLAAHRLISELPKLPPEMHESVAVISKNRRCRYFESYQPLRSFREHLDAKSRRTERRWALAGAAAGGSLVALVGLVFRLAT